ncbi:MAG: PA2779 family protein [Deltaproteobacteria bacterium]|nr:PA2779 family protein [Deltaproteobacteria bacterium]
MQVWIQCCRQGLALLMAVATVAIGPMVSSARAELVTTASMLAPADDLEGARDRVAAVLARDDVREQLSAFGLDADETGARVASLSDAEIAELDARLASLPAGQDFVAVVGSLLILTVLVLFLTDVFGWTDVFSFVNPQFEVKRTDRR